MKGSVVIVFGAPGSGKGTQSARIQEQYNLIHVSTGNLLRKEIAKGTELGKLADDYMSKGHLLPDQVVLKMVDQLIGEHSDANGFVFDGFPRTITQAEGLDHLMEKHNRCITALIDLVVPEDELVARLLKRKELEGRDDDNLNTIANRLKVYYKSTAPLADFYQKKGLRHEIDGQGELDRITEDIYNAIEK